MDNITQMKDSDDCHFFPIGFPFLFIECVIPFDDNDEHNTYNIRKDNKHKSHSNSHGKKPQNISQSQTNHKQIDPEVSLDYFNDNSELDEWVLIPTKE